jgi:polynucleotide 5'-triphosphatase
MQHKHFNQMLNRLKMEPPAHSVSPIDYKHHRLVDSFYEDESSREKIRVTRDEKTGQVVECLRKIRLGDLNIYGGPKRFADWRVSVTLEVPGTSNSLFLCQTPV